MPGVFRRNHVSSILAAVMAFNGFVNLATGLAPIFRVASYLKMDEVPEYLRLTSSQRFSGILSVLLGVLLIALGKGLYERHRRSWGWSLAVMVILVANNLYRGTTPQTSILSVILIAALVVFRKRFDVRSEGKFDYGQIVGLVSVLFALSYGIVGAYLLRAQFSGIETWTDAVYFTLVTYSTVGYGDVLPQTANAKFFTMSMILIGLTSFVTALTVLLGPMLERRMKGVLRMMSRFQKEGGHVVVCGYSSVSESVIDELQGREVPYLVVDDREHLISHLQKKGHDALLGDATQRETLEQANVQNAQALIAAFDSDSVNTLVAITARELRDAVGGKFRIVVRVEDEENVEKVRRVGADEAISPSTLGGRMMATKAVATASA